MSKAHKGFVDNSGVQSHSAGSHFPYTIVCIGGFPALDNDASAEVWGPDGRKDGPFSTFGEAEEWAHFLSKKGSAAELIGYRGN